MTFEEQRNDIISRAVKSARIPVLIHSAYSAVLTDYGRVETFGPNTPATGWDWQDIVSLAGTEKYIVGLKADGTLEHSSFTPGIVNNFKDIIMLACGDSCIAGLKMNGTVVVSGEKSNGEYRASEWKNIVSIQAGRNWIMGLRDDGTVLSTFHCHRMSEWTDIVSISGEYGLKSNGKVVTVSEFHKRNISAWKNIVQIAAGKGIVAGLRSDGTVVSYGNTESSIYKPDWHGVSSWKNIKHLYAGTQTLIGIDKNGKVFYETNFPHDGFENYITGITEFIPKSKSFLDLIMFEAAQTEERMPEMERYIKDGKMRIRRAYGICQHCGGKFSGLFFKRCSSCGIKKDY